MEVANATIFYIGIIKAEKFHNNVTQPTDITFYTVLYKIVAPIILLTISVAGCLGNSLVIHIIRCQPATNNKFKSINLLLLNLALADLLFLLVLPPFTVSLYVTRPNWPLPVLFGKCVCKLMHYFTNVTAYVTIYTLVAITALRYMAILHTMPTAKYRSRRSVCIIVAAIWGIMLAVNAPVLKAWDVVETEGFSYCEVSGLQTGRTLFLSFFLCGYVLPLTVILLLSCMIFARIKQDTVNSHDGNRKKDHASKLVVTVVIVFAVCWLPIQVNLMVVYYGEVPASKIYECVFLLSYAFAHMNSCVNPVIYNYTNRDFQRHFHRILRCQRHQLPLDGAEQITKLISKSSKSLKGKQSLQS